MARIYLGILLLAMAAFQIADLRGFVDVMETYRIGGAVVAAPLAVALVAGEVTGGLWLLGPSRWRVHGAIIALAAAVAWTVLGVQAFARGLELENCGCFGVYLAQELRWWVLVQDAVFIGIALLVWHRVRGGRFGWSWPGWRPARRTAPAGSERG